MPRHPFPKLPHLSCFWRVSQGTQIIIWTRSLFHRLRLSADSALGGCHETSREGLDKSTSAHEVPTRNQSSIHKSSPWGTSELGKGHG